MVVRMADKTGDSKAAAKELWSVEMKECSRAASWAKTTVDRMENRMAGHSELRWAE